MAAEARARFPDFDLYPATTTEQILKTYESTCDEWGAPLMDVEQYIRREKILADQAFTRENLTIWLYGKKSVFENDPSSLDFVSHCETFRRRAILKKPNEDKASDITCHSIASVYCQHAHRGHGYGSGMMATLIAKLTERGELTTLYSDVGDKFYSRFGWKVYPLLITEIPTNAEQNTNVTEAPVSVSLMDKQLVKMFIDADAVAVRNELGHSSPSDKAQFLIVPSIEPLEWRWARDEFEGIQILQIPEFPQHFGAFISNGSSADELLGSKDSGPRSLPSFVIWTPRFRENSIQILRARFNSISDVKPLIEAALAQANKLSLSKVSLWNTDPVHHDLFKSHFAAEFIEKKTSSLPSAGILLSDDSVQGEWVINENYCWV